MNNAETMIDEISNPVMGLPASRQPMCNNDVLRFLADGQGRSVAEMVTHFGVTQTAIRARLRTLTAAQSVARQRRDEANPKRGRPQYLYYITSHGTELLATGTR